MVDLSSWKPYAVLSLVVPLVIIAGLFALNSKDLLGLGLSSILLYSLFPLLMMSIYMWSSGKGHRWINGPDWTKMSESTRAQGSRIMGLTLYATLFLIFIGLAALSVGGFSIGLVLMISCTIGGVAVCVYGTVKVSRKSFEEKWKYQTPRPPSKGAVMALISVTILAMIPVGFSISEMGAGGSINVSMDENDFTVKGPMFDHTFRYSDVDTLSIDEDFDKGRRVMGYGTSTISSGDFRNSEFGDYKLASYAKIKPCIVITVGGEYYAFNQSSDNETHELYEKLRGKIPL
jgi:hypothetical protein